MRLAGAPPTFSPFTRPPRLQCPYGPGRGNGHGTLPAPEAGPCPGRPSGWSARRRAPPRRAARRCERAGCGRRRWAQAPWVMATRSTIHRYTVGGATPARSSGVRRASQRPRYSHIPVRGRAVHVSRAPRYRVPGRRHSRTPATNAAAPTSAPRGSGSHDVAADEPRGRRPMTVPNQSPVKTGWRTKNAYSSNGT